MTKDALGRRSLSRRAATGSIWTLLGFGINNGIRLASNLFITRLLEPEAFGVMAVTTAVLSWLSMLSDFGVKPSIIRSKHGTEAGFLATARTVQLIRGVALSLLLASFAGALPLLRAAGFVPVQSVYADSTLPLFLLVVAAATAVAGFDSIRVILKERDLIMRPVVQLELGSQVVTVATIAGLALLGFGGTSLVLGSAAGIVTRTAGSYLLVDGPSPGFGIDREYLRELLGYGKWLIVASFFGFLINRGGEMILGYYIDHTQFSLYAIGAMWVTTAKTVMQQVVQKIAFPAFAEVARERPEDRTQIYYRARLVLDGAALVCFLAAYFLSEPVFELLYSEKYVGVGHFVRLSSIGLLLVPYTLLSTLVLSDGDSRRFAVLTLIPGLAMAFGVPLIFSYGGLNLAIMYVASVRLFSLPLTWHYASKLVKLNRFREIAPVLVLLVCLVMTYWGQG
jgi:O-antigen/teichoic acid export membrane protein